MPKLSICIPVEAGSAGAGDLVRTLLSRGDTSVEIVVMLPAGDALGLDAETAADPRLRLIERPGDATTQSTWRLLVAASTGDWVTLVRPGDMIETELCQLVTFLERKSGDVDALAWNIFQINPQDEPGRSNSVAIPIDYQVDLFDKQAMLKAFFYWENSLNVPKMPFGLYHGALRRSLVETILALPTAQDWSTPLPQYEWAAKVLLCSDNLAFCARPLSAMNVVRFDAAAQPESPWTFPFNARLGLTGAVAEVQFHCLRELGAPFTVDTNFVRPCMIDCMMETDRKSFLEKGNAYFAALQRFDGENLAPHFRPDFREAASTDHRRGLHGKALLVDRFLGGARNAPEFYSVAKSLIVPVGLICDGAIA